jgi:UDP-N-acetylmuramoyl-L-alanyl-D-glutamate--2,6-diaminopimelate ligase
MQLSSLIKKIPLISITNFTDCSLDYITHDSRNAGPKSIFVAIIGKRFDGRKFIEECEAKVIILDKEPLYPTTKTILLVPDARRAMALTACALFDFPAKKIKMIGITGTNGKTTSSWMLYHILRNHNKNVGVIGTLGHHINSIPLTTQDGHTTPESSHIQSLLHQMIEKKCDVCLMEVSSIGLDLSRVDGINFNVAVFTNFTQDHLDFHPSMKQYLQAKQRLFTELVNEESVSILNADQELVYNTPIKKGKIWSFGRNSKTNWRLRNINKSLLQTSSTLQYLDKKYSLAIPLVGEHNLENAVVAISAAYAIGVPVEAALLTLSRLPQVAGRVERVETHTKWHAFVDYAHTPDALEKVLLTLKELTKGRLLVIFGCGGDRDSKKRPLMGKIASSIADKIFVTSDNPRTEDPTKIIREIALGIEGPAEYITNRREAIRSVVQQLVPNDVLLVAGKGHETYQIIGENKFHFDDREEILEAL